MKKRLFIGIDIGGTNMRAALVDDAGSIQHVERIATRSSGGAEDTSRRLIDTCRALVARASEAGAPVTAVGMGVAGKIDARQGLLIFSPNIPTMRNYPLGVELREGLGLPVFMENDANVFGLGENWVGSGRDVDNWIGLTLGTGVGGCIFFHSRLWEGDNLGFVAEIGHLVVHPEGPACACGSRGCLEAHASATALLKGVEDAVQSGSLVECPLFDRWRQQALSAEIIYQCASAGDETALKLFRRMGWALGLALSNLFTVLGIRHAILGGGVSASWDFFIGPLRESFTRYTRFLSPEEMVVVKSSLGDNAALLGAARHAMDQVA